MRGRIRRTVLWKTGRFHALSWVRNSASLRWCSTRGRRDSILAGMVSTLAQGSVRGGFPCELWRDCPGERSAMRSGLSNLERADRRQYGLEPGERVRLEAAQHGVCAICERPPGQRRLHVDHHHACSKKNLRGSVRGLLCMRCNRGLFGENPVLLRRASHYFAAHLVTCPVTVY